MTGLTEIEKEIFAYITSFAKKNRFGKFLMIAYVNNDIKNLIRHIQQQCKSDIHWEVDTDDKVNSLLKQGNVIIMANEKTNSFRQYDDNEIGDNVLLFYVVKSRRVYDYPMLITEYTEEEAQDVDASIMYL